MLRGRMGCEKNTRIGRRGSKVPGGWASLGLGSGQNQLIGRKGLAGTIRVGCSCRPFLLTKFFTCRRNNQAAATHMLVEAIFWLHPPVWSLGVRLVEERERACEEQVLKAA